uniref:Uncharacterized protein n=1 Tax=Tetradesmus obliquus TaxID=3088 RepID=A0A383WGN2_TETOB|eukprot:jgi/Sobl393_1/5028/SZX75876.1
MFISVYGLMIHEYYQVLILTVVFGIYLISVVWLRPFRVHANQQLQAASTAVLFSTSLCMLTFIEPQGLDAEQQQGYEKDITILNIFNGGLVDAEVAGQYDRHTLFGTALDRLQGVPVVG